MAIHTQRIRYIEETYSDDKGRDRGNDARREDERDDNGRVLRIGPEDVVDLGLLAVAQRRLVRRSCLVRVELHGDVEDRGDGALRRAERAQHEAGTEGLARQEQLERQVLMRLVSALN